MIVLALLAALAGQVQTEGVQTFDAIPAVSAHEDAGVETRPDGNEDEGPSESKDASAHEAVESAPPPLGFMPVTASAPIRIDTYSRDYEPARTEDEARYEADIENRRLGRQNQFQTLEGHWRVYAEDQSPFLHLILRTSASGSQRRIEGAWRREGADAGVNASGFIDAVIQAGPELEISYFPAKTKAPNILHVRRHSDGLWRGTVMTPDGKTSPVTLAPAQ